MEEVSEKPVLGGGGIQAPKAEDRPQNCDPVGAGWPCSTQASVSQKDERLPEVEINTVLVEEINPPDAEEPITWLLLTSLPVDTF